MQHILYVLYESLLIQIFILPPVIRSGSGDYIFTVGPPGTKFKALGVEFTYDVILFEGHYRENITSAGKLNESVTIEVKSDPLSIIWYTLKIVM